MKLYKPLVEQTCDVDVVDDAEDVVMVDLAFPLVLEDVVHGHGAPDLSSLSHHLPARSDVTVQCQVGGRSVGSVRLSKFGLFFPAGRVFFSHKISAQTVFPA